nr:hypothetical protein [Tanacetum cinerariifolium]
MLPLIATPPRKNIVTQSLIGIGKSVDLVTVILYCVDLETKNLQAISIVQNDYLATKMPPVEAQVIIRTPLAIRGWIMAKKLVLYDMKMLLIDDADRVLAEIYASHDGIPQEDQ